jgi:hypothetical protein
MISKQHIQKLYPHQQTEVKKALAILSASRVILAQLTEELERLAYASSTDSDINLMDSIRVYRLKTAQLKELQQLGESYAKEQNNA